MADWLAIHWILPSCRLLPHPLPPGSRTIQEGPYVRIDEGSHLLATAGDHTLPSPALLRHLQNHGPHVRAEIARPAQSRHGLSRRQGCPRWSRTPTTTALGRRGVATHT